MILIDDNFDYLYAGALRIVDIDNIFINTGIVFEAIKKITLQADDAFNVSILIPDNKTIHYRIHSLSTTADNVSVILYEDSDVSGGTLLIPINHNRNSDILPTVTINEDVNVTTYGPVISQYFIGGSVGVASTRGGGQFAEINEWILKKDTNYLLSLHNGSSEENTIQINLLWYERD